MARYESLDIWRGFACLLVLANHAVFYKAPDSGSGTLATIYQAVTSLAARGWMGVPIFFVISGYCIAASADGHRRRQLPVATFFYKRFRRIFPPYWVVLFATAAVIGAADLATRYALTQTGAVMRPWWYSPWQWAGSITLTEQWRYHLVGGQKGWLLGHAWTLGYEEQFYAVCGALLACCPRRFFSGAGIVTVMTILTAWLAHTYGISVEGFFFDGGWVQFALGVGVYYVLSSGSSTDRGLFIAALAAVVAVCLWQGREVLLAVEKQDAQAFLVAATFAGLALAVRGADRRLTSSRWLAPIRICGVMCYSLYLVHLPVINITVAALAAAGMRVDQLSPFLTLTALSALSIAVAWGFHLAVERRFMSTMQGRASEALLKSA